LTPKTHVPFALVLAGGGVRGLAHAGVLRAIEHYGFRPSAVVGVSMGAVVAVTYALNPDWHGALVNMDTEGFPEPTTASSRDLRERIRALLASERMLQDMVLGWGVGARTLEWGRSLLDSLTLGRSLEEGHVRVATVATDLCRGQRVVLQSGNAAEAAYASAALAGLLPPLPHDGSLLVDGCYADLVPIDVARGPDIDVVIAVDVQQQIDPRPPTNGVQAMLRAMEICSQEHARLRFKEADYVVRPQFPFPIDTLEFSRKRFCIAAGSRAVRASIKDLRKLLERA
jgi:NTE family protein